MATINFQLQSKSEPANIYIRLSIDRKNVFRRKTGFIVNPNDWSKKTNLPLQNDVDLKNLKTDLTNLKAAIETNLNEANKKNAEINGDWLQSQIETFQGKVKTTDKDSLVNCIQGYVDFLPRKKQRNGKRGVSVSTIKKYKSLKVKIEGFEKFRKKKINVQDVGLKFIDELEKYFLDIDLLNGNTTGRYIKFVKTVCLWASSEIGLKPHSQLTKIKGYTDEAAKVFLTFDELEAIQSTIFERIALENAKDWLIIGCFIGQRVSDLLKLTSENITVRSGLELIELTQQKTGKRVVIPLHPKVKAILDKRNGNFPYYLSDVKFNIHIKEVCKLAGIDDPTEGGKMVTDKNTGLTRKQYGKFPKYELISSHVCRRSYATNFYGEIPTSWLISITAHSTERQFLEYVGKSEIDTAQQIADYYAKQMLQAKKEPQMTVLSKAN